MAITDLQRNICQLISANRMEQGESYVAGGVALNTLINASRLSRDIDLFHDSYEALAVTWEADRKILTNNSYGINIVRERPTFVEAVVTKNKQSVLMQWTCDSAYRFFPLVKHDELGLTLHPFDLATNKVLSLVGRLEVRDWIDLIHCHKSIQKTGYLVWAACGKDPGFNPSLILEEARRSTHYTEAEVAELSFDGPHPDIRMLSKSWKEMLKESQGIIDLLPAEETGKCVLDSAGRLFQGGLSGLKQALEDKNLMYHCGRLKGAFPEFIGQQAKF